MFLSCVFRGGVLFALMILVHVKWFIDKKDGILLLATVRECVH